MFNRAVETVQQPQDSALWQLYKPGDFIDGYRVKAAYAPRQAAEIAMAFPRWVHALLRIRQIVTLPFGLKQQETGDDTIAIFPVVGETEDEIVLGFDDNHLDFRISILSRNGYVHCATWVHRHNLLGRVYLTVIMPFHVLITRQMMVRLYRQAQSEGR